MGAQSPACAVALDACARINTKMVYFPVDFLHNPRM
jgi:hypothetical protein